MKKVLFQVFIGIFIAIGISCNAPLKKKTFSTNRPGVVFYEPDSMAMIKMQKEMDSVSWADVLEDNQSYYSEALELVNSANLHQVTTDATHLEFIKQDGSKFVIEVDTMQDRWGMFLFDGIDDPNHFAMTDMLPALEDVLMDMDTLQ